MGRVNSGVCGSYISAKEIHKFIMVLMENIGRDRHEDKLRDTVLKTENVQSLERRDGYEDIITQSCVRDRQLYQLGKRWPRIKKNYYLCSFGDFCL